MSAKPIAYFGSDLHLSHVAPVGRAEKGPAWYAAMATTMSQIRSIVMLSKREDVISIDKPLILAGDIFHSWNSPPELINFALREMSYRATSAIPGNHDLPFHRYEDKQRSAYDTLKQAKVISDLHGPCNFARFWLWSFPCGANVIQPPQDGNTHIAVIHAYVWKDEHGYPEAQKEDHVTEWAKRLKGYKVAFFGDNHNAFISKHGDLTIVNCGCLIRRKRDEINYQPSLWALNSDFSVKRIKLDVSHETFSDVEEPKVTTLDTKEFLRILQNVDVDTLDFKETVMQLLKDRTKIITSSCMKLIMRILEDIKQ